jgi:hypothetical protein
MTNEMLKKLTRMMQDYILTAKFSDFPAVFASREFKSALELNQQQSETDQTNHRNNIHF